MYFTTTRLHQELAGGTFVDVIIDEAHDPPSLHPFKGNVDLEQAGGADRAASGPANDRLRQPGRHGQHGRRPAGLAWRTSRAVRELCDQHGIRIYPRRHAHGGERLLHPAARGGLRRQAAWRRSCKEFCSYTDGALDERARRTAWSTSAAGWRSTTRTLFEEARNLVVVYEGLHTYGGMAGRDMEAMAIGIEEAVQDDHIRARIGQVRYLGELLHRLGHPDRAADRRARDLPRRQGASIRTCRRTSSRRRRWRPSSTWTRACARWSAASSAPAATRRPGDHHYPKLELVRLTIPRRVYTQAHMDVVAESVQGRLRRARADARAADGLRAEVPALLPGALRAAVSGPAGRVPGMKATAYWTISPRQGVLRTELARLRARRGAGAHAALRRQPRHRDAGVPRRRARRASTPRCGRRSRRATSRGR